MATMRVYDATTQQALLGRNPTTSAELDLWIDGENSPLVGSRPYQETRGYWNDNQPIGFDISSHENIGIVIDYGTIAIPEEDTYEFDIDSDAYGELWVGGILVAYEIENTCTTTPIHLTAGEYSFVFKFQNGVGPYSFALRWRRYGEVTYVPVSRDALGLPEESTGMTSQEGFLSRNFTDYCHRLTIRTQLDDVYVRRRVIIRSRANGDYIVSGVTDSNGFIEFTRLPVQSIANPHVVLCFDDRQNGYTNALVWDRVFQVNNQGFPPEN